MTNKESIDRIKTIKKGEDTMKKILSIIICISLIFTLAVPAFASENTEKCPIVYVHGIASSTIYLDKDNPDEKVDTPDKEAFIALIKKEILPALVVYAATRDVDKLSHTVSAAINDSFRHWFNNTDGTAKGNSGVINNYPAEWEICEGSLHRFRYDWRGDPIAIAGELNDYINYITENSEFDKVALTSHSLGAVVVLAYLSLYGNDKVYGYVMDSPAIEGVSYVGDLLCGEIEITGEGVLTFLKGTLGKTEYEELIASSLDILEMAGVSDFVVDFLDDAVKKMAPVLFEETLFPIFGYWLTIWAMVPEDRIDECMAFVKENYNNGDLSVLMSKIEAYNSLVREKRKETLLSLDESARVAVISRYGHTCFPITSSWELVGDAVIETKSSSLGAETAPLGDYFSEEYLKGKDMKYISPDKTVDASTCLFPEKTWFFKDILHEEVGYTRYLHTQLLFFGEEATCDNFTLSRFSVFDRDSETFINDETQPQKAEKPSPLERLFNFLKALFDKLIIFFKGLGK